ncbi:hypothetical protein PM082_018167 [Marasmius tenuissimus]|nr:hypothetical protein PM082_018167 [Marasmius tenuissimus]
MAHNHDLPYIETRTMDFGAFLTTLGTLADNARSMKELKISFPLFLPPKANIWKNIDTMPSFPTLKIFICQLPHRTITPLLVHIITGSPKLCDVCLGQCSDNICPFKEDLDLQCMGGVSQHSRVEGPPQCLRILTTFLPFSEASLLLPASQSPPSEFTAEALTRLSVDFVREKTSAELLTSALHLKCPKLRQLAIREAPYSGPESAGV